MTMMEMVDRCPHCRSRVEPYDADETQRYCEPCEERIRANNAAPDPRDKDPRR